MRNDWLATTFKIQNGISQQPATAKSGGDFIAIDIDAIDVIIIPGMLDHVDDVMQTEGRRDDPDQTLYSTYYWSVQAYPC